MVVFVSIKENMMQERMRGNQKKMINARLAAEKGIYDTQQLIAQQLSSGQNIAAILTRINNQNTQSPQNTSYYRTYSASYNAPLLTFISQGHHQDADSYLAARFNISTGRIHLLVASSPVTTYLCQGVVPLTATIRKISTRAVRDFRSEITLRLKYWMARGIMVLR